MLALPLAVQNHLPIAEHVELALFRVVQESLTLAGSADCQRSFRTNEYLRTWLLRWRIPFRDRPNEEKALLSIVVAAYNEEATFARLSTH